MLTQESGHGPIEQYSGAYRTIEVEHAKIHDGLAYMHNGAHNIANGVTQYHLLKNPAFNYPHLRIVTTDVTIAPAVISLYETPTTTADGTTATTFNYNRNSANTSSLLMYENPTVTAVGTLLESVLIPSGGGGGGSSKPGGFGIDLPTEWILKQNTNYLVAITNNSGSTIDAYVHFFWYE